MKRYPLQVFAAFAALVPVAFGQGSDDCSTPTPIAGAGTFAWSNATATQGGTPATCANMFHDVWFAWTATATDQFELNTCGLANWDTVIAVHAGSTCPVGPYLACNDDACGLQSRVAFSAVAGNTYMFQLGSFSVTLSGTGSFQVTQGGPVGCTPAVGPDVIVGDVSDVGNYNAAGGLDAIALGTTSCNMGSAPLNWFASTNQHPVIGGNLYRYKVVNGTARFEQIGMSWLKHGFAAGGGSLCCTCQGGGGSQLGIGCSDPYSSGLNGSQGGLGPRWQVNASTGNFTYPPANPAWSGSTARRIEIALTDLEPTGTGTRYFGECQYVTPDDAASANQNNNTSWREMTASGNASGYTFALLGPTQRTQSAIRAWAQIDNQVLLTDAQVQSDGLFVVGSRVYDLGGGQWRYEYAVYNMNSNRSGGTFSVPVPVGASVSNAGFHGVTYRNGDGPGNINMSSTDWTFALAGGVASWSTDPEALNANANALRWGTTYNFRFDCNVAPTSGNVTLGLWRTGLPASMDIPSRIPGPANGSSAICLGNGSGTACPCGNNGTGVAGCANSQFPGGVLVTSGTASVSADTLLLSGSAMPDASCVYFQGTAAVLNGAGAVFGDGLRCAGGFVTRLGAKTNVASSSSYPGALDPSVSSAGSCVPGDVRVYQVWYRNASSFCTPATFNLTNAWQVLWQS